jgi:hypothetical protein
MCRVPVNGSKFRLCTGYKSEPDSEVGPVTRLRDGHPRNRGSIAGRGNNFVPTPKRLLDRLLQPTRLRNQWAQQGFFEEGWVVGVGSWRITPSNLWIKNKWSYISTPLTPSWYALEQCYFLPSWKCLPIHKGHPNLDGRKLSCFQVLRLIHRPNKYSTWLGTVYLSHKNWSSENSYGFSIFTFKPTCMSLLPVCLHWAKFEVSLGIKEYKWKCSWTEKRVPPC